ncbi:hypothetical protein BJ912DRAFT_938174 [Pholiota molesta]|nr:hypothetical protein BJ912DRAFT_938174 [Pholiota molesta]
MSMGRVACIEFSIWAMSSADGVRGGRNSMVDTRNQEFAVLRFCCCPYSVAMSLDEDLWDGIQFGICGWAQQASIDEHRFEAFYSRNDGIWCQGELVIECKLMEGRQKLDCIGRADGQLVLFAHMETTWVQIITLAVRFTTNPKRLSKAVSMRTTIITLVIGVHFVVDAKNPNGEKPPSTKSK